MGVLCFGPTEDMGMEKEEKEEEKEEEEEEEEEEVEEEVDALVKAIMGVPERPAGESARGDLDLERMSPPLPCTNCVTTAFFEGLNEDV